MDSDLDTDHSSQEHQQFTPKKITSQDPAKFTGIRISSFSRNTDEGEIVEFLIKSGLTESYKDSISIKQNGTVIIETLPNSLCLQLIENIHSKIGLGKRLYCNGIVPRTPDKPDSKSDGVAESQTGDVSISVCLQQQSPVDPTSSLSMPINLPAPLSPMTPNTFSENYSETPDINLMTDEDLVRRNSLSLRSPPPRSLAADILGTGKENENFTKAKSIIDRKFVRILSVHWTKCIEDN